MLMWTVALFTAYLVNFSADKTPGNIFVNGLLIAVSNLCGNSLFFLTSMYFSSRVPILIALFVAFCASLLYQFIIGATPALATVIFASLKGLSEMISSFSYQANLEYFAPLYQSRVYALTNCMGAVGGLLAPVISNNLKNPMLLIPGLTAVCAIFVYRIGAPKYPLRQSGKDTYL